MRRHVPLPSRALPDTASEVVRRETKRAIDEWQASPAASTQIINGVEMEDGVATRIPHGLGRAPRMIIASPIYLGSSSAGRIVEERSGVNRAKAIVLYAFGFGSTITLDIEVK